MKRGSSLKKLDTLHGFLVVSSWTPMSFSDLAGETCSCIFMKPEY
jgi:hypothetical protein